jgi:hypothetical protein
VVGGGEQCGAVMGVVGSGGQWCWWARGGGHVVASGDRGERPKTQSVVTFGKKVSLRFCHILVRGVTVQKHC